jgi:hypothetical protein
MLLDLCDFYISHYSLKMEAAGSSETFVLLYQTTRHDIPKENTYCTVYKFVTIK